MIAAFNIFIFFLLIQIIARMLFALIERNLQLPYIKRDYLRLVRELIIFTLFLTFLYRNNHVNITDLNVNYKWLTIFLTISIILVFFEEFFLNNFFSMNTASYDVIKKYPVSQLFSILVFAPIIEELLCRKFILGYLFPDSIWLGIIISTLIFTVLHFQFGIMDFFLIMAYGLILSLCFVKTNSVINPIIVHIGINFVQLIFIKLKTK